LASRPSGVQIPEPPLPDQQFRPNLGFGRIAGFCLDEANAAAEQAAERTTGTSSLRIRMRINELADSLTPYRHQKAFPALSPVFARPDGPATDGARTVTQALTG
jgi:hypothetical protein